MCVSASMYSTIWWTNSFDLRFIDVVPSMYRSLIIAFVCFLCVCACVVAGFLVDVLRDCVSPCGGEMRCFLVMRFSCVGSCRASGRQGAIVSFDAGIGAFAEGQLFEMYSTSLWGGRVQHSRCWCGCCPGRRSFGQRNYDFPLVFAFSSFRLGGFTHRFYRVVRRPWWSMMLRWRCFWVGGLWLICSICSRPFLYRERFLRASCVLLFSWRICIWHGSFA